VQTFVAQAYGAGELRSCGRWAWQGLHALVPVAVVWFALVALAIGPFLALLGSSPELHSHAVAFATARLCGGPAVVASVVLNSFFRGLGDTRTPLVATLLANLLNAVLSYGLVFGVAGLPAWGVAGAGAATAVSMWVHLGIVFSVFRSRRLAEAYATAPVMPSGAQIRRLARVGAPIGGQWLLDMVSFALFTTLIARMGERSMAASHAMVQLLSLSFMQALGISIAAGALVGRYVGARDLEAAERSHRSALKLGLALAIVVAALFLGIPDVLLGAFTDDREVLAVGRRLLALAALFQLLDAVGIIASGSLRGAGDTRWPFVAQATLAWALRLPLVYVAAVALDGGIVGAWLAELVFVVTLAAIFLLRFERGAWRSLRI
jgi:MATE family multidrug resistance protein